VKWIAGSSPAMTMKQSPEVRPDIDRKWVSGSASAAIDKDDAAAGPMS